MRKFHLIIILFAFISFPALAQEESEAEEEEEGSNLIAMTFGYTFIPGAGELEATEAAGFFVPTIGADYFRRLSEKWELGLMLDLEMDSYLVINKELRRERATILALATAYKVTPNFQIILGAGMEWEENENLIITRLGAERPFSLGSGWRLGPALFFDFKEGYDTWSLSLSLGKEF